jgi:hypothetical protein
LARQKIGLRHVAAAKPAEFLAGGGSQIAIDEIPRDGVALQRPAVDIWLHAYTCGWRLPAQFFGQGLNILRIVRPILLIARIDDHAAARRVEGSAPRRVPERMQIESPIIWWAIFHLFLVAARVLAQPSIEIKIMSGAMKRLMDIADQVHHDRARHGRCRNVGIGPALEHDHRTLERLDHVAVNHVVVTRLE